MYPAACVWTPSRTGSFEACFIILLPLLKVANPLLFCSSFTAMVSLLFFALPFLLFSFAARGTYYIPLFRPNRQFMATCRNRRQYKLDRCNFLSREEIENTIETFYRPCRTLAPKVVDVGYETLRKGGPIAGNRLQPPGHLDEFLQPRLEKIDNMGECPLRAGFFCSFTRAAASYSRAVPRGAKAEATRVPLRCPEYASRTQFEVDEKGFVCVVECVEIETLLNTERFNENFSCRNRRSDPSFVFPLFLRAMRVPGGNRTVSRSWAPLSMLPDPRTTSRSGSLASLERRIIFRAFASLRVANFGRV